MSGWTCEACAKAGRRGYCAPRRCYCGHVGCHAFPSWEPLPEKATSAELMFKHAPNGRLAIKRIDIIGGGRDGA